MKVLTHGPFKGLSVRSANALSWHYEKLNSPLRGMSSLEVKYRVSNDIENGKLNLLQIRNCGPRCTSEIQAWLGSMDGSPESYDILVDAHMSKGVELDDPYWKLFECKNAVNDSIVEAYKLGYKRGLLENKGKL